MRVRPAHRFPEKLRIAVIESCTERSCSDSDTDELLS